MIIFVVNKVIIVVETMDSQKPQLIDLNLMHRVLVQDETPETAENLFLAKDFAMLRQSRFFLNSFVQKGQPYMVDDYRMAVVRGGTADAIINLQERHIESGMITLIGPGTILQPQQFSSNYNMTGMVLSPTLAEECLDKDFLNWLTLNDNLVIMSLEEDDRSVFIQGIEMLWKLCQTEGFVPKVTPNLVAAMMQLLRNLVQKNNPEEMGKKNRSEFQRFLSLVNRYCDKQRKISFYAEQLYITPHYLSSLIRQQSGMTAKDWIDKGVITKAKAMLNQRNLQVAEVSYQLGFPNPSFFVKYFKRLTGVTPNEYRE